MGQGTSQPPIPNPEAPSADRLESWKEVAAYLKREVRTVQRWEKREGLPIHRLQHDKLGSIYAYKSELDTWWNERRPRLEHQPEPVEPADTSEPDSETTPPQAGAAARIPRPAFSAASRVGIGFGILILLLLVVIAIRQGGQKKPVTPGKEKTMLVVLPFLNLSGDPAQEPLCDGFTEEMITQLSRLQPLSLGVIARTTSMQYKGTNKTVEEIGRELEVDYVLEGSVRRDAGRVRITPQLVQVSDQSHRWADDYDRDLESILVVQSEVAKAVAKEIQIILTPQVQERLASVRLVNTEAYDAYLWGWHLAHQRTPQGLADGVKYFKTAIEKDAKYAPSYAGLANALNMMAFYSYVSPAEVYADGHAAAKKALELDDTLAEAHSALANLQYEYEYNWTAADKSFQRMLELDPSYAQGRAWYADYLALAGRTEESKQQILMAQKLDPLSTAIATDVALSYYYAREFDRAVDQCGKVIVHDPTYALAHFWLGRALLAKGNHAEAIAEFQRALEVQPGNLLAMALLGNAYGVAGKPEEAKRIIQKLKETGRHQYVTPAFFSIIYLGLKDDKSALDWADKAMQEHAGLLTRLNMDPIADGLRGNPRFKILIQKLGFPAGKQ